MLNTTLYGANDSDVTLAYLEANHITYQAPVYDPVFAAGIDPGEMVQVCLDTRRRAGRARFIWTIMPEARTES